MTTFAATVTGGFTYPGVRVAIGTARHTYEGDHADYVWSATVLEDGRPDITLSSTTGFLVYMTGVKETNDAQNPELGLSKILAAITTAVTVKADWEEGS